VAISFKFYTDIGLTAELVNNIIVDQFDTAPADVDFVIYLGSTDVTKTLVTEVNPGVDQIVVSLGDLNPGVGPATSDIKLSLTSVGLDAAIAGDPLIIGTSVLGGVSNAVAVFARNSVPIASGIDITLSTNAVSDLL
jgi:hypothetical protein